LRLAKLKSIVLQANSQTPLTGHAEAFVDDYYSDIIRSIDLRRELMTLAVSDHSATLIAQVEQHKLDALANLGKVSLSRTLAQKNLSLHLDHILGNYIIFF